MRCRYARRAIHLALDGELALERRFALDDHTVRCAACRRELERSQRLDEALELLPGPALDRIELDRALEHVHAGIEREEARARDEHGPETAPGFQEPRTSSPVRWAGALVGLAAVLLVFLELSSNRPPAGSSGDAAPASPVSVHPVSFEEADRADVALAVRKALVDTKDAEFAAVRFDELVRPIVRVGWPVLRFVEAALDDEDPHVVTAAMRYLGERGDARSAGELERILDHEERRSEAFLALGRMGSPAVAVLGRLVEDPDHGAAALQALVRVGGEGAADRIARLLSRKARGERIALSRTHLLDELARTGPFAVARLLDLAESGRASDEEVLPRLPGVESGGLDLARRLQAGRAPSPSVYAALSLLQPAAALPWLEERCEETRERERALDCLSRWSGLAPCATLLRLHVNGRVDDELLVWTMRGLADRGPASIEGFTESLILRDAFREASDWLELLFATEHEATAKSLALLALSDLMDSDERQWAALAVGELGTEPGARTLLEGYRTIDTGERRLRAACLISIHALLGEPGVRRALNTAPPRSAWGSLLASLDEVDRRDRTAYGVHRVARALDKCNVFSARTRSTFLP